jgi:hypothetical protein
VVGDAAEAVGIKADERVDMIDAKMLGMVGDDVFRAADDDIVGMTDVANTDATGIDEVNVNADAVGVVDMNGDDVGDTVDTDAVDMNGIIDDIVVDAEAVDVAGAVGVVEASASDEDMLETCVVNAVCTADTVSTEVVGVAFARLKYAANKATDKKSGIIIKRL